MFTRELNFFNLTDLPKLIWIHFLLKILYIDNCTGIVIPTWKSSVLLHYEDDKSDLKTSSLIKDYTFTMLIAILILLYRDQQLCRDHYNDSLKTINFWYVALNSCLEISLELIDVRLKCKILKKLDTDERLALTHCYWYFPCLGCPKS